MLYEDGAYVAHTLPEGSFITVDEAFTGNELVSAKWEGKRVMIFTQDLRLRTEPV